MKKRERGVAIIIAVVAVAIIFTLGGYLLNSTVAEKMITESIGAASRAYYVAEGGVNEALWRIQENEDGDWDDHFLINGHSSTFEGDVKGSSYFVTVNNIAPGYVEISSVGETPFLDKIARREIKATVFRAIGSPVYDAGIFTGSQHPSENIDIDSAKITVTGGNLRGGNVLAFKKSTAEVTGEIISEQVQELQGSQINAKGICSGSVCIRGECEECPPSEANPPKVNFDEGEYSFLSRAVKLEEDNKCNIICEMKIGANYESCMGGDYVNHKEKCVLSSSDFNDILNSAGEEGRVSLENEITYVDGNISVEKGVWLEIEGILVVSGDVVFGRRQDKNSHIRVTEPGPGKASGILAKGGIDFNSASLSEETLIQGVVYAYDVLNIIDSSYKITIEGAMLGRKVNVKNAEVDIILDSEKILRGLGYIIDVDGEEYYFEEIEVSPVIQINHWEEVY